MSTEIRPELSRKNKYWISKHRYYELKHFCLQYNEFKDLCAYLEGLTKSEKFPVGKIQKNVLDPVGKSVEQLLYFKHLTELIEKASEMTDPDISFYILKGVTDGLSFTQLKMRYGLPYERDAYYLRYRKFFYILNLLRMEEYL